MGAFVKTPDGTGHVIDLNLLTDSYTVRLKDNPDAAPRTYSKKDLVIIKDNQIRVNKQEIEELKQLEDK